MTSMSDPQETLPIGGICRETPNNRCSVWWHRSQSGYHSSPACATIHSIMHASRQDTTWEASIAPPLPRAPTLASRPTWCWCGSTASVSQQSIDNYLLGSDEQVRLWIMKWSTTTEAFFLHSIFDTRKAEEKINLSKPLTVSALCQIAEQTTYDADRPTMIDVIATQLTSKVQKVKNFL